MLNALEVVTTVIVGLLVGVEFAVAVILGPILDALPDDSRQLGHAHGGRMLGAVMPFWYIGSVVLAAAWAIAGWGGDGVGLVITAAALLVASVLMSVLVPVPINNRSKNWTPENRPTDWKQQHGRWQRWHYLRVAVLIAAFVLVVTALA